MNADQSTPSWGTALNASLIITALILSSAGVQASEVNESSYRMPFPGEVRAWTNATLPEDQADSLRTMADKNNDGNVSQEEAGEIEEQLRHELEQDSTPRTTLNGLQPSSMTIVSFTTEGLVGPVDSSKPLVGFVEGRLVYPLPPDPEVLEWKRNPSNDELDRDFRFKVSGDWIVNEYRGLLTPSSTEQTVAGVIGSETITIRFEQKTAGETEDDNGADDSDSTTSVKNTGNTNESGESEDSTTPGLNFVWIFACIAIIGILWRTRNNG